MIRFRSHWACRECLNPEELAAAAAPQILEGGLRVLNLYSGIGGNRLYWPAGICVTAVEYNPKVAAAYKRLFPADIVIVGDAHTFLLKHYFEYDFIWSSRPCVTHSRMNYIFDQGKKRYADLGLYQEILLLREFFKGRFVVENVNPYYGALIPANYRIDRHLFWANFPIEQNVLLPDITGFMHARKDDLQAYLGIRVEENLYLSGKSKEQVYRNCVHPLIGKSIFSDLVKSL